MGKMIEKDKILDTIIEVNQVNVVFASINYANS